jgi:S-adenosylmethionine-dependent methyltransferase
MQQTTFEQAYTNYLNEEFFKGQTPEFFASFEYTNALREHIYARTERFGTHLLPWIEDVFPLKDKEVVEIGSGTGALTAVFAPRCRSVDCYEIDARSLEAAKRRAQLMGWQNVVFADGPFGQSSDFARSGRKIDAAIFVGVVEHMHFPVFEDVIGAAWQALRPDGVLIVVDTPNRLCPFDFHTSWLPFFQSLPYEIRKRYYYKSPREQYVRDLSAIERASPHELADRIQSWGIGVSYHDFEIVLGDRIHDWIIADGWDERIYNLAQRFPDDEALLAMWQNPHFSIKAHKAFARSWLYFIIRKPA